MAKVVVRRKTAVKSDDDRKTIHQISFTFINTLRNYFSDITFTMVPRNDGKDGAHNSDEPKPETGLATLATLRFVPAPLTNISHETDM